MLSYYGSFVFNWSYCMSRIYVVVPIAVGVGAPDVAKAFYEALKSKISHVGYFSPL